MAVELPDELFRRAKAEIAALARQHALAVVSRDARFDVVPALTRRGW